MLNYSDYLGFVEAYMQNHPEQRVGQAHYNVFEALAPWYASEPRLRGIDPYYDDDNLAAFLEYAEECLR